MHKHQTSLSNMVAKDMEQIPYPTIPRDGSKWPKYKLEFLIFAGHKRFKNALTKALPPIPATSDTEDDLGPKWERARKAEEKREDEISDAWYYLNAITSEFGSHHVIPRHRMEPDQPHLAWKAICQSFENAAGSSQRQVLMNKLESIEYVNTGDVESDFLVLTSLIDQVKDDLAHLDAAQAIELSDLDLTNRLLTKLPEDLYTDFCASIKRTHGDDLTFSDYRTKMVNEIKSRNVLRVLQKQSLAVEDRKTKSANEVDKIEGLITMTQSEYTALLANQHFNKRRRVNGNKGKYKFKNGQNPDRKVPPNPFQDRQEVGKRSENTCYYCGKLGHFSKECRKRIADVKKKKKEQKEQNTATLADPTNGTANVTNKSSYDLSLATLVEDTDYTVYIALNSVMYQLKHQHIREKFYLDSGCTAHICYIVTRFDTLDETVHVPVKVADGRTVLTSGIGTIGSLPNVYYVPEFSYNLISVSMLAASGLFIIFGRDTATIHDNNMTIVVGIEENGLYAATEQIFTRQWFTTATTAYGIEANISAKDQRQLWHQRFGHINYNYLINAKRRNLLDGFDYPTNKSNDVHICEYCIQAKSTRQSTTTTPGSLHAQMKLQLKDNPVTDSYKVTGKRKEPEPTTGDILRRRYDRLTKFSMDLKGPLPVSHGKYRYALIITCYVTRFRWIYFLRHKNDTTEKLILFVSDLRSLKLQIRDVSKIHLIIFKSDNGTEFVNEDMKQFMREQEICHETTSPHTPHQNGIAERTNRTIAEAAVAMLLSAKVSFHLWSYAMKTAVYLWNRMSNQALHQRSTPYFEIYGTKPNVSNLRTFGCEIYAHLPDNKRPSFGPKAVKGIFIGYDEQSLSYLYYHKTTRSIYKTGHIRFNEDLSIAPDLLPEEVFPIEDLLNPASDDVIAADPTPSTPTTTNLQHVTVPTLSQTGVNPGIQETTNMEIQQGVNTIESTSDTTDPVETTDTSAETTDAQAQTNTNTAQTDDIPQEATLPPPTIDEIRIQDDPKNYLRRNPRRTANKYSEFSLVSILDAINAITSSGEQYFDKSFIIKDEDTCIVDEYINAFIGAEADDSPTYEEALQSPDRDEWILAINEELTSLDNLNTWTVVDHIPAGRQAIGHKWVMKIKRDLEGNIDVFRARLTAKGFTQKPYLDFKDTFAPVARQTSLRLFLSMAVALGLFLRQADVKSAFPNADLSEVIYMQPPTELNLPQGSYLRLNKALYGLKQASREWYLLLSSWLKQYGFRQCVTDNCIFIKRLDDDTDLIVLIYVDDLIIAGRTMELINDFLTSFKQKFIIKEKPLHHYLGMEINYDRERGVMTISLESMIRKVIQKFESYLDPTKTRSNPMDDSLRLCKDMCPKTEEEVQTASTWPYRQICGSLIYIAVSARPDISFAVNKCAQFMDNPGQAHWNALTDILIYLRTHPDKVITYTRSPSHNLRNTLFTYSDSDHGNCVDTRRSTSGVAVFMNGGPVSWTSKRQPIASGHGTGQSEYQAMFYAGAETVWLRQLLEELHLPQPQPTILRCDNQPAINFAHNPVQQSRMKSILIKYHAIRDFINLGHIEVIKIDSKDNYADMLTKPVSVTELLFQRSAYLQ
jgi:hypothetical protein